MAMTLHVDIVSAEAELYSGCAERVVVPGMLGEIGIVPRHAPLLTCLRPGQVRVVRCEGEEELFYVAGGILEVPPYLVTILSDTALRARDIDEAAALEAKRRAEYMLRERSEECDCALMQAELTRALAQLQAVELLRRLRNN